METRPAAGPTRTLLRALVLGAFALLLPLGASSKGIEWRAAFGGQRYQWCITEGHAQCISEDRVDPGSYCDRHAYSLCETCCPVENEECDGDEDDPSLEGYYDMLWDGECGVIGDPENK